MLVESLVKISSVVWTLDSRANLEHTDVFRHSYVEKHSFWVQENLLRKLKTYFLTITQFVYNTVYKTK